MKLIIRSSYWGNVLKGKPRVDAANPARSFRTISSQAVLTIEGKYWGCCQGQGKRVLEMTEQHFMDTYRGDWDLYLNQLSVDVSHHVCYNGWQYYGTISATAMRKQLSEILADTFAPNENIGFRYHHVHIEILMSHVTDYAARAKKAAATGSGKTSPVSVKAEETNENTKPPTPIPGVSKSASHDASATEVTSSPSTCTSYHEVQHEVPQFVHSGSFDQEMICYPIPMPYPVMHPTMPPTMYQYQTYAPTYMPMHMGVVAHNSGLVPPSSGLAHYNMYHHPPRQSINPTPMAHSTAKPPVPQQQEPSKELQSAQNTTSPT